MFERLVRVGGVPSGANPVRVSQAPEVTIWSKVGVSRMRSPFFAYSSQRDDSLARLVIKPEDIQAGIGSDNKFPSSWKPEGKGERSRELGWARRSRVSNYLQNPRF